MENKNYHSENTGQRGLSGKHLAVSIAIMAAVVIIILALFNMINTSARQNVLSVWEKNVIQLATNTEYFLARPADVIEISSSQVEMLMDEGKSNKEIGEYLIAEMDHYASLVENNYTGVYGYVRGDYLDASGWTPGADYEAKKRPWYTAAKEAKGEVALVSPFMNLQTNKMMMSISRMLNDGESVLSIDIYMDGLEKILQDLAKQDAVKMAFIVDNRGVIVAHNDEREIGVNYLEGAGGYKKRVVDLANSVAGTDTLYTRGIIDTELIYADKVNNDWVAVMVLNESKVLKTTGYLDLVLVVALLLACLSWYGVFRSINRKYIEAEQLNREVSAVADIYEIMILVDLKADTMEILRTTEPFRELLNGDMTNFSGRIKGISETIAFDEYKDVLMQFTDPSKYDERIKGAHSMSYDFIDRFGEWSRLQIIIVDRDSNGELWHVILAFESIDEERRKQERLRRLAETDALSGLKNRRSGEAGIREILASGGKGLFLVIDADDFKSVNDNIGHDTGDLVIVAIADSLKRAFRESDIVFRLGGDEFAVFAQGVDLSADTETILDRLHDEVSKIDLPELGGWPVTVSAGYAFCPDSDEDTYEDAFQRADQRMYEIKRRKKENFR